MESWMIAKTSRLQRKVNIIEVIDILSVFDLLPIVLEIEKETFFIGNIIGNIVLCAWSY